ncbi:MAG: hypothetical protein RL660_39 [Bacteroidota bacterium]|jgi:hypothetical protein
MNQCSTTHIKIIALTVVFACSCNSEFSTYNTFFKNNENCLAMIATVITTPITTGKTSIPIAGIFTKEELLELYAADSNTFACIQSLPIERINVQAIHSADATYLYTNAQFYFSPYKEGSKHIFLPPLQFVSNRSIASSQKHKYFETIKLSESFQWIIEYGISGIK